MFTVVEFFVSPTGHDSAPGTESAPFATLERARHAARQRTGEVVVQLRAGVHQLTGTFELTDEDSGEEGAPIVLQAYGYGTDRQESVALSGGRIVTEWEQRDGVWLADIGDMDTRELYVDGRRVERAGVEAIPGQVEQAHTGYRTDSSLPMDWRTPGSVEFVYRGIYPWTEARCPVSRIGRDGERTFIEMRQPAFEWANALYNSSWEGESMAGPGLPSRVENDPCFLVRPGTFVLDRTRPGHHRLHYLPADGEEPNRTTVSVPTLQNLVSVNGAREVSFRGVTFADATWCRAHGDRGFLHYHGNGYYDGGPIEKVAVDDQAWVTVPGETQTVPAGVTVTEASNVRFEGCRFTRFGAAALAVRGGTGVAVLGCEFDTLGGSAIDLMGSRACLVEDTRIRHIGLEYSGSPALSLLSTVDCVVRHNQIAEVPHCGIVAGPGAGTQILRNLITGSMSTLADGGGIYLSAEQGDSWRSGALVVGNVIRDTRTPYNFALYADYGARWVTFERNVVIGADNTAVLQVGPPLENVMFRGNLWDADPIGLEAIPRSVGYEDNATITDAAELEAASAEIQQQAGLLRDAGRLLD